MDLQDEPLVQNVTSDVQRKLPCDHWLHEDCFEQWVRTCQLRPAQGQIHPRCPACRTVCNFGEDCWQGKGAERFQPIVDARLQEEEEARLKGERETRGDDCAEEHTDETRRHQQDEMKEAVENAGEETEDGAQLRFDLNEEAQAAEMQRLEAQRQRREARRIRRIAEEHDQRVLEQQYDLDCVLHTSQMESSGYLGYRIGDVVYSLYRGDNHMQGTVIGSERRHKMSKGPHITVDFPTSTGGMGENGTEWAMALRLISRERPAPPAEQPQTESGSQDAPLSPCPDCTLEDGSKIDQWMFCERCDASGTIPVVNENQAEPTPTTDEDHAESTSTSDDEQRESSSPADEQPTSTTDEQHPVPSSPVNEDQAAEEPQPIVSGGPAPSPQAQPAPEWACPLCTILNTGDFCQLCQWACPMCTTINDPARRHCMICDSRRPPRSE